MSAKLKAAKERVWKTVDGKLVSEGDPKAAILVAREGQRLPADQVTEFDGHGKFFSDVNPDDEVKPKVYPQPQMAAHIDPSVMGSPQRQEKVTRHVIGELPAKQAAKAQPVIGKKKK